MQSPSAVYPKPVNTSLELATVYCAAGHLIVSLMPIFMLYVYDVYPLSVRPSSAILFQAATSCLFFLDFLFFCLLVSLYSKDMGFSTVTKLYRRTQNSEKR